MILNKRTCIRAGITVVLIYLAIHYWSLLSSLLLLGVKAGTPLFLGMVLAYIINIPMSFFEKQSRKLEKRFNKSLPDALRRGLSILLALLSIVCIVIIIMYMILPELSASIKLLIESAPRALAGIESWIGENIDVERLIRNGGEINAGLGSAEGGTKPLDWNTYVNKAVKYFISGIGATMNSLMSILLSAFSLAVTVLVAFVFSLYLVMGKEKLKKQISLLLDVYLGETSERRLIYVARTFNEAFHSFIVGQCIEAMILGLLCTGGMLLFRFPYASMIGTLVGFTALIPVAGAYIGMIVGALMIFTVSPLQALFFIIYLMILQQIENNLIYPRVVGSSIGLPGIWVMASVTIGGSMLGVAGMLLGVPTAAALYRMIREDVYQRKSAQKDKEMD